MWYNVLIGSRTTYNMRHNILCPKGGNMFTGNMLRRLFLGLVFVVATSLTGCGMPTYSSSSSGFVDYGGQQPMVSSNTQYLPVQNNGYVRLPSGKLVPVQPGAQYSAQTGTPQFVDAIANGSTGKRVKYQHETQESSVLDASAAIKNVTGSILDLAVSAGIILREASPHDKEDCPPPPLFFW